MACSQFHPLQIRQPSSTQTSKLSKSWPQLHRWDNVAVSHWAERCEGLVGLCNLPVPRCCFLPFIQSYFGGGERVVWLRIVFFDPFVQHLSSHGPELQLRGSSILWLHWVRNREIQVPLSSFLCSKFSPKGYRLCSFLTWVQVSRTREWVVLRQSPWLLSNRNKKDLLFVTLVVTATLSFLELNGHFFF